MGDYITADDINIPADIKTYLDGTSGTDDAIFLAEGDVNFSVYQKYESPLAGELITPLLKGLCIRITLYYLYLYIQGSVPAEIVASRLDANRQLEMIAAGDGNLGEERKIEQQSTYVKSVEVGRA